MKTVISATLVAFLGFVSPAAAQQASRVAPPAPRYTLSVAVALLPHLRAGELRDARQRRLRGVQPEHEVLVGERGVDVGGLVPVRIPATADVYAAFVLAQTH